MSGDGTYVPRSPDLSSFFTSGPTSTRASDSTTEAPTSAPHSASTGAQPQRPSQQFPSQFSPQQQQQQHQQQHLHLHTRTSSTYFAEASVTSAHVDQQQPLQRQQYAPPQSHRTSPPPPPPIAATAPYSPYIPPSPQQGRTVSDAGLYNSPQQQQFQHHQRHPSLTQSYSAYQPPTFPPASTPTATLYAQSALPSYATPAPTFFPGPGQGNVFSSSPPGASAQPGYTTMPPKRGAAQAAPPPMIEPSPVKTKFPTARIKRIMQADEEVGKVAQQTPIAVGKALEMFMIQLVNMSADVAREKSSKRVSAAMLKQVVESDDQWDFLREIVGRVEEDKAGGGGAAGSKRGAKTESDSEEEVVEKKKRGGRKKKAA